MSEKGFGSKIFGLFVESDGQAPTPDEQPEKARAKSPAEELAELAARTSPAGARPPVSGGAVAPSGGGSTAPAGPGGKVDFDRIFREAGMDVAEMDRVAKAEELLRTLPADAPQAVKKQIVEAALRAFGFETQRIVAAAQNQQRAIDTYVKVNESATAHALQEAENQVKTLNEKIAQLRADSEKRSFNLTHLSGAARTRKLELDKILTFFQSEAGAGGPPGAGEKT